MSEVPMGKRELEGFPHRSSCLFGGFSYFRFWEWNTTGYHFISHVIQCVTQPTVRNKHVIVVTQEFWTVNAADYNVLSFYYLL